MLLLANNASAQQRFFTNYTVDDGLPYSEVLDVFQGPNGYLWVCTNGGGAARFDGSVFEYFSSKNGLPSNVITCGVVGSGGRVWLGTNNGLACLYNDSVYIIGQEEGLVETGQWLECRVFQEARGANGERVGQLGDDGTDDFLKLVIQGGF